MMIVTFTKPCAPYNAGDTAGFPEAQAMELIGRGVARAVSPSAQPARGEPPAKAQTAPPVDKMVKGARTKGKGK